jgi:hypothetical protein
MHGRQQVVVLVIGLALCDTAGKIEKRQMDFGLTHAIGIIGSLV